MTRREQIRDFLITKLSQIRVSNGYNNDVKKVTKYVDEIFNLRSFPVLVVYAGEEEFEKEGQFFYQKNLTLYILGLTEIARDTAGIGKIVDRNESLIEDIIKCINSNEPELLDTFNCVNAQIISISPYLSVNDEGSTWGQIEIIYRVSYVE